MKNDKKYTGNINSDDSNNSEIAAITEAIEQVMNVSIRSTNAKPRRKFNYSKKIMSDPFIMNC